MVKCGRLRKCGGLRTKPGVVSLCGRTFWCVRCGGEILVVSGGGGVNVREYCFLVCV